MDGRKVIAKGSNMGSKRALWRGPPCVLTGLPKRASGVPKMHLLSTGAKKEYIFLNHFFYKYILNAQDPRFFLRGGGTETNNRPPGFDGGTKDTQVLLKANSRKSLFPKVEQWSPVLILLPLGNPLGKDPFLGSRDLIPWNL